MRVLLVQCKGKNIDKHGINRALKARREFGKAMKLSGSDLGDTPSAGNGDSGLEVHAWAMPCQRGLR